MPDECEINFVARGPVRSLNDPRNPHSGHIFERRVTHISSPALIGEAITHFDDTILGLWSDNGQAQPYHPSHSRRGRKMFLCRRECPDAIAQALPVAGINGCLARLGCLLGRDLFIKVGLRINILSTQRYEREG